MKYLKRFPLHMFALILIASMIMIGQELSSPIRAGQNRDIRVVSTQALAGQSTNISVEMLSLGNENKVAFSLTFDPAIFTNPVVSLGGGAAGAALSTDASQAAGGRLGMTLTYPPGQTFTAGVQQLVSFVAGIPLGTAPGTSTISFDDQPTARIVTDVNNVVLPSTFTSGVITIIQPNQSPTLIALNPSSRMVGGDTFSLSVTGTNFVSGSTLRWNGGTRITNFVSSTRLTALITSTDLATAGTVNVTVVNPPPGGGLSNGVNFSVTNPAPSIVSINPATATTGSGAVTVSITGTNFVSGSIAQFDDGNIPTTFVSATQLTAMIPVSALAAGKVANLTVVNPAPGGGASNAVTFTVNNPLPAISSLTPNSSMAGSPAFTITLNGTGFVNGSTVQWNGGSRTTTFVSATQMTAAIPATDLANIGSANITVVSPAPGGGTSNTLSFTIGQPNPVPTLTRLNPSFANTAGSAFDLTVTGTNFTNSSVVRWNDSDRPTTFVSATQLRAAIPASDLATAGTYNVKVFTPSPGGGITSALPFLVAAPLTSVSAASFLGPQLGAESIIAGFGQSLATRVQAATTLPLPTDMAGTKIMVRDSQGTERLALQFYVSPGQSNYQLPPDTVDGGATVVLTSGDNKVSVGGIQVTRVVPGIFTANANGLGVAAATILRVSQDGSQRFEPMARFDSTLNRFVSLPVDLGAATDQLFLVMFGTGFRYRSSLSAVTVSIGGTKAEVTFAGPAPGFVGLDQCNVRLPRSLAGRGEMDVIFTADEKTANTSRVNMK